MVIGTFSTVGPATCGGSQVKQYSEFSLPKAFGENFYKLDCLCLIADHSTPTNKNQNFVFCSFLKKVSEFLKQV